MRAAPLAGEEIFLAIAAKPQFAAAPALVVVAGHAFGLAHTHAILEHDGKSRGIERVARRFGDLHDALAKALFGQLPRPIVAIGIVAALPGERIGHPGASAAADVPVVARGAKTAFADAVTADRLWPQRLNGCGDRHLPRHAAGIAFTR